MKNYKNIITVLLTILFSVQLNAEGDQKNKQNKLYKTNGQPEYARFNINTISTWIKNDGEADINRNGNSGFVFPKGSNRAAIYQSGFVYGGVIDGQIRVGGSTWLQGQVPGKILSSGIREDSNLPHVRIFRVRRDYKTADLSMEVIDEARTKNEIYDQYEKDWNEWRAEDGAPFEDINKNGVYEPSIDIPGEPGADQTIWFVANDLDTVVCKNLYGSLPMGIEMQITTWGYLQPGFLSNIMFKRITLINKSGRNISDMYASMWSDYDLGNATDDFGGCDSLLNLGFAYNGNPIDATYGDNPPAIGFQIINDFRNPNYNHSMGAFNMFYKNSAYNNHPNLGRYKEGTLEMYNAMKGLWTSGGVKVSPSGDTTNFSESGDPINKTGWYDGINRPPGDRGFLVISEPFDLATEDTQKIVFAQSAVFGENNLDAVTKLKNIATYLKAFGTQLKPDDIKMEATTASYNNKIILKWSYNEQLKNSIEDYNISNIVFFEGYNIYQLSKINSPKEDYKLVKTYDKINGIKEVYEYDAFLWNSPLITNISQFGTDSGLERFIEIEKDYINNTSLKSGTPYYFVISSYIIGAPDFKLFNSLETFSEPIKIVPHNPNPGIKYESEIGDTISVSHFRGTAEADVNIIVVDPSEVNGHEYEISFKKNNVNKIVWDLDDVTENKTVLSNQQNISGTDDYLIVDGIRIVITQNNNNQLTENDLFRFTTPKVIYDEEQAKVDVEKINVFPNPYYGYNPMETQKLGNFVMINHLPRRATIRIFNLAGHLVRTLHKDSDSQFYLWDLQNEHQVLAASGLYILHIEMPDLGKVKILKLAIVLGTEVPDFY